MPRQMAMVDTRVAQTISRVVVRRYQVVDTGLDEPRVVDDTRVFHYTRVVEYTRVVDYTRVMDYTRVAYYTR